MRRIRKFNSESNLQIMVADYLRLQYPGVIFMSNYGAGLKLSIGQASIQKRQNGGWKGLPDMFIAKRKLIHENHGWWCGGLFIELKKEGTRLKKKNGDWATPHIAQQAEILEKLRKEGYKAEFACGFNEAIKLIDEYLKG